MSVNIMNQKLLLTISLIAILYIPLSGQLPQISAPKPGDSIVAGKTLTLSWQGAGPSDSVNLYYTYTSGKSWRLIAENLKGNSYQWTVPDWATDYEMYFKVTNNKRGNADSVKSHQGFHGYIEALDWSPDGTMLAVGSSEGYVRLVKDKNSIVYRQRKTEFGSVIALEWSPDGTMLAVAGSDNYIRILEPDSLKEIASFRGRVQGRDIMAWSPNSRKIAALDYEFNAIIWDIASACPVDTLTKSSQIKAIVWSPDGKYIASAGEDKKITIWNAISGVNIQTLSGHPIEIVSLAWSPNNNMIASGDNIANVKIWNCLNWTEYKHLEMDNWVANSISWSQDCSKLIPSTKDGSLYIWRVSQGDISDSLIKEGPQIYDCDWSSDGKIACGGEDKILRIWDNMNDSSPTLISGPDSPIYSFAINPAGTEILISEEFGNYCKYSSPDGLLLHENIEDLSTCSNAMYSPDSLKYLTVHVNGDMWVWNAADNMKLVNSNVLGQRINWADWSPDSKTIACACQSGKLIIWDAINGQIISQRQFGSSLSRVLWAPDGTRLLAISDEAYILGATIDNTIAVLPTKSEAYAWSRDSRYLAQDNHNNDITISDAVTGQQVAKYNIDIKNYWKTIFTIAWGPDDRTLIFGTGRGWIYIIDPSNGVLIKKLIEWADVNKVALLPDGMTIVSSSADSTIRYWQAGDELLYTDISDTPHKVIEQNSVAGTKNISNEIVVGPMPASGSINITLPDQCFGEVYFRIMDINGRTVITDRQNISGGHATLHTGGLPAGVYFLNVEGNGFMGSRAIMYVR